MYSIVSLFIRDSQPCVADLECDHEQNSRLPDPHAATDGAQYVVHDASGNPMLTLVLAIGLQFGFRSFRWIAAIPPIIFVIAFKLYTNRVFLPRFNYYIPTEDELRTAKVHSERADAKGNRLEKRFGHPSLHADLFTPMLHAKMMPLLSQVYSGKIGRQQTKLDEYGGQKMDAQVIEGGIKIAAIDQVIFFVRQANECSLTTIHSGISNMIQPCTGVIAES